MNELLGKRVMKTGSHAIGVIKEVRDGMVFVDFHGEIRKFQYPAAFAGLLELEDENIHREIEKDGMEAALDNFKRTYKGALFKEINFLKLTGGKKYKLIDGERLSSGNDSHLYAFDTDTELHFPDGTIVKLWLGEKVVPGYVVSCEDYSILIRTVENIGNRVESVDMTAEQWQLLEALIERLDALDADDDHLAYEIAINGKNQISDWSEIRCGQNQAFSRATSEAVTFIWGPPGTGKTETLANIALEHIGRGRRVLMLSYSNVSVDGALLRVAGKADLPEGMVIRYGYPRTKELLESDTLTSFRYVLGKYPEAAEMCQTLMEEKRKLKRRDPRRIEINKRLNKLREILSEHEKLLIRQAAFVATTVSKATVDSALYNQRFDVVIFDEASMAYVPQIVFAASLATDYFICMGDFCQLPAIVQNNSDDRLTRDIFDYTGISSAVGSGKDHNWLVMLNIQYRMHPDISDFVSELMYGGRLKTEERIIESREEMAGCHPCPGSAMSMIDLSGMYSVCTKTMDGSRINMLSALVCLRITEQIINRYEVGIITPYNAQSRLLLSMVRDMQEQDERWHKVTCATVHQFQGSEKPVILYDAVDCFRMPYPGMLLTSMKNQTANRLFNVAITRAKGKFILVANRDYLERKKISKSLMFTKALLQMEQDADRISGSEVIDELKPADAELPKVYLEDREKSWQRFMKDIEDADRRILIDVPDVMNDDDEAIEQVLRVLKEKKKQGVEIVIRVPEEIDLPQGFQEFTKNFPYVTNPVTLIDGEIVWFGQPLCAADFISEGNILDTEFFPCARFKGSYTARAVKAFLEM